MLRYLMKRIVGVVPILFIVSIVIFLFIHLIPGDPARLIAGPEASEQDIELVRMEHGLDKPIYIQYFVWISEVIQGDLGTSMKNKGPVFDEIANRFMPTLWLTIWSMAWSVLVGVLIGVISAVNRRKWQDYLGMIGAVSGISLPSFWLGLMLIQVFSVYLGWLPTGGNDSWSSYILPSFALGSGVAAIIARFTRSSFMDILKEDYIRTGRAKGLRESTVIWKHALKNAMIPVATMTGLQFGFLLSGAIVVETVFNWPGLGRLLIDSISFRDYPVIQAELLLFALEFILINLIIDVLYTIFNPQIQYK